MRVVKVIDIVRRDEIAKEADRGDEEEEDEEEEKVVYACWGFSVVAVVT